MLIFNHSTMGGGKSALLIAKATTTKRCLVIKPGIDTRDGGKVWSRNQQWIPCDKIIGPKESIIESIGDLLTDDIFFLYVDEAQFFTEKQIMELLEISIFSKVIVECFGLLVNFKSELFEGSKRLIEVSDTINEIASFDKTGERAKQNGRFIDGELVYKGPELMLGKDESYMSLSNKNYFFGGKQ